MKRICMLLLVLLMLAGCSPQEIPVPETTVDVTEPSAPETVPTAPPEPESDDAFVRVLDYIPSASQELRYATKNNFTGQVIYDFGDRHPRNHRSPAR